MRRRAHPGILAVAALLAGCPSPAAPSATESATPDATRTAAATPRPMATATPEGSSSRFTWPDEGEPVVTREMTGIDESYINPGAVIDHEDVLHMYANLFTAWPGTVQVAHLTSSDGIAWAAASEGPIMTTADVPFATAGHDVSSGFVADDGTWILVFTTVDAGAWQIGLATAPGPDGPWSVLPEPVLVGDGAEAGEAGGLAWPSVVPTNDGWAMYFVARDGPRRGGTIEMATSADGLTWTRRDEPVLTAEAEWEYTSLDRPRVVRTDDGYVMVYAGRTLIDRGLATSEDGVSWTRLGDGPAIVQADFPVPNADAWDAALVERDGVLTYYLEIGFASASAGTQVHRAVAPVP